MYQGAAETGLFHEGRQPRSQTDSTGKSVMAQTMVQYHKMSRVSGTKLVIARGTIDSPETISLGKVRSQVQIIQTISVWAGNTAEHRYNYSTAQTRTGGIELSCKGALGPCGERGRGSQGKVVWNIAACQCTRCSDTTSVTVLSKERHNEWIHLFSNTLWCLTA